MGALPKLMLKPLRSGYGFKLGVGVTSTDTQIGLPRQRLDSVGVAHKLSPTYKCTAPQWQYFTAFLRAYRGRVFLAYLLLDEIEHGWYECRMVNDSVQVSTLGASIFTFQLDLVVKPKKYDVGTDMALVEIYNLTDGKMAEYYNQLEKLVNQDLPNAVRGL